MATRKSGQCGRGKSTKRARGTTASSKSRSVRARKQKRNANGTFASGKRPTPSSGTRSVHSGSRSKSVKSNSRKQSKQSLPPRNPDGTFKKVNKPAGSTAKKQQHSMSPSSRRSKGGQHSITYSTKGYTPKMLLADKMIDTSRCSSTMRRRVLSSVAEGFTREEIILIGKHLKPIVTDKSVQVRGMKKGGYCRVKRNDGRSNSEIDFNPSAEISTIIHEFVHHLRTVDESRTKYSKTAYPTDGKGREKSKLTSNTTVQNQVSLAEETATISETEIRLKKRTENVSSHWSDKGEKDAKEVRDMDRNTLRTDSDGKVLPEGKNLTGEKAKEHLNRNYPKTIVSQRKTGGKTALSIFHDIINKRKNRKW